MRLTGRGAGVLVGAVVLFALGQWAGYPVLLAVAAACGGALVAAVLVTVRRPHVAVQRDLFPDRVERGRPAVARLRVRNTATSGWTPAFTAGDRFGSGFHAVAVRPLAPGADAVYHYELPTTTRGRHEVGPLTLDRVDALSLGRRRLSTGDTTTLWVHPRTYPMRALAGGHPRHHHEGRATEKSLRGSLDVREVREYMAGDEVRHLHWKATARTGRLMVRDYADPNQPRFTALLDDRHIPGPGDGRRLSELDGRGMSEEAVDLVASLVVAAAKADHRCRLVTSGGTDITTRGGVAAVRRLLDELCVLDRAGAAGPLVPPQLTGSGGGTLVAVSTAPGELGALATLRARYTDVVLITIGAHGPAPRVPGVTVLPATGAQEAADIWNAVIAR